VFIVLSVNFVMTQSGNFWVHPRISLIPGTQDRCHGSRQIWSPVVLKFESLHEGVFQ